MFFFLLVFNIVVLGVLIVPMRWCFRTAVILLHLCRAIDLHLFRFIFFLRISY